MKRVWIAYASLVLALIVAACGGTPPASGQIVVTSTPGAVVKSTQPPTPPLVFPTLKSSFQVMATATPPAGSAATYDAGIEVILQAQCGACHGDDRQAGLRLTVYADALAGGDNGPVIIPGDSANSKLITFTSSDHSYQLTGTDLDLVKGWIDAGAPEK